MTNTVRQTTRPRLWIVAGPNGSGKSSAYDRSDIDEFSGSVWIINPDLLTVRIRDAEDVSLETANLEAVNRIEAWLNASLEVHQTIGVETVLSTAKYRRLVTKGKSLGFEIRLIYVYLRSAEEQIERIALRVTKGGHAVPDDKVRERRERSFDQLPWFLQQADEALIYDNSGAELQLVAKKSASTRGHVLISEQMIPELLDRIVDQA